MVEEDYGPTVKSISNGFEVLFGITEIAFVIDHIMNQEEVLKAMELYLRLGDALVVVIVPFRDLILHLAYPIHIAEYLHTDDVERRGVLLVPVVQGEVSNVFWQTQKLGHHTLN